VSKACSFYSSPTKRMTDYLRKRGLLISELFGGRVFIFINFDLPPSSVKWAPKTGPRAKVHDGADHCAPVGPVA